MDWSNPECGGLCCIGLEQHRTRLINPYHPWQTKKTYPPQEVRLGSPSTMTYEKALDVVLQEIMNRWDIPGLAVGCNQLSAASATGKAVRLNHK